MKKLLLLLAVLTAGSGLFGQEYCTETEYKFIQWVKEYYNALEVPETRRTAYDYFKRDVAFETFNESYENTDIFTLTNFKIEKIKKVTYETEEIASHNIMLMGPDEIDRLPPKSIDLGIISFLAIHKEIIDGKVERSFYEVTFDNLSNIKEIYKTLPHPLAGPGYEFSYRTYDFGKPVFKSNQVEQPISDEEITLLEYYRYMENSRNIEKAYEISKKAVPLETYLEWYPYERADIDIIIKNKKDNLFNIELYFIEYYLGDKVEQSSFSVDIKTDADRVLWSQSVSLHDKNIGIIEDFMNYLADEEYKQANSLLKNRRNVRSLRNFYQDTSYRTRDGELKSGFSYTGSFRNRYEYKAADGVYYMTFKVEDGIITSADSHYVGPRFQGVGGKPVIYLYPEQKQDTFVNITTEKDFIITIPEINDGWNVTAYPDGRIVNKSDNKKYPYLFWEAGYEDMRRSNKGFVVKRGELSRFFDEKLTILGLKGREITDFKEFWLQQLKEYPYYFITFVEQREIDRIFELTINPKPDCIIRVFFDHEGLEEYKEVEPQYLEPKTRWGYSAIEWGGNLK